MNRLLFLILIALSSVHSFAGKDTLLVANCSLTLELARNQLARGDPERAKALMDPLILGLDPALIGDSGLVADILFQEGNVLMALSDPPGAVKAYKEGRKFAVDPLQVSRIDQNLGAAFFLMDDYQKSVMYLNHSFLALVKGGFYAPSRLLAICGNLGSAWFESGDPDKAEAWWKEADRIRAEFFPDDPEYESGIAASLGNIYFQRQQWAEAIRSYRKSLRLLRGSGATSPQETSLLLRNLALALGNEDKPDSALDCLQSARSFLAENGKANTVLSAELSRAEGAILLKQEDFPGATCAYDCGLSLLDGMQNSYIEQYQRFRLKSDRATGLYNWLHRPGSEHPFSEDSLFLELLGSIESFSELFRTAGNVHPAQAKDSAAFLYRRAIETGYQLIMENRDSCFRFMPGFFSELKSRCGPSSPGRYLHVAGEVPDTIKDLAAFLGRRLFYYHKSGLQDPNSFGLPSAPGESEIFRLTLMQDSLIALYPAIRDISTEALGRVTSPDRIKSALMTGEVLLDYVISGQFVYLLACSCDTCMITRMGGVKDLLNEVSEAVTALSSADMEWFGRLSPGLSGKLIGPISGLLEGASRIIVIPDPSFSSLPFECLANPGGREQGSVPPLVGEFSISYGVSLGDFLAGRGNTSGVDGNRCPWFGCAPFFDPQEGLTDLQFSREEVRVVAALFREAGKNPRVAEGRNADEKRFLEESPSSEIIHIASHSRTDPIHPELSGLFLWKDDPVKDRDPLVDGMLELGELGTLDLNCDLLVLSSCSLTEEPGLAGTLINAGADNILFSLWNVPDRYTSALMTHFYRFYLAGSGYAGALRKAKLELLKDPATANPFIWGGFVLYGRD